MEIENEPPSSSTPPLSSHEGRDPGEEGGRRGVERVGIIRGTMTLN